MKKVLSISICIIAMIFVVAMANAQMGGGKSGGMMGGQQGNMMEGQGSQGHMKGMMQDHDITGGIMHQMGQMSRLMQQMREMMAMNSDAENMNKMSGIMKEMSEHIEEMSKIMNKGNASEKEMKVLEDHNLNMQKKYDMMRW